MGSINWRTRGVLRMKRWNRAAMVVMAILLTAFTACSKKEDAAVKEKAEKVAAEAKAKAEVDAKVLEAREVAIEGYIYAYPLVTMELTRRVMTNVEKPEATRAPMGQFLRIRTYPPVDDHAVTAPNADTLYTIVWLDVSKEPWVVSIPDMKGRFFLFPMLDGWTAVFEDPGKRTTGTGPQKYAITGPGWSGDLPKGVTEYKSPTGIVWVLGRIYCTGTPEDYKAVHALQDKVTAVPLSAYGKPYSPEPGKVDPAIDMKTGVRDQVHAMDAVAYFKLFAELLKTNPPATEDAPMVAKLAKIGIVPGQDFDVAKLDPAVAKGVASASKPAQDKVMEWLKEGIVAGDLKLDSGWLFTEDGALWDGLPSARAHHCDRTRRQPSAGCGLSDVGRARRPQEVQRRAQVRHALQQGRDAAGQGVLVAHDVRRGLLLRAQRAQPLHAESAQQIQNEQGRRRRSVHPTGVPRQGQGRELAAGTGGAIHSHDAAVLAHGDTTLAARRHLENSRGERGSIRSPGATSCDRRDRVVMATIIRRDSA